MCTVPYSFPFPDVSVSSFITLTIALPDSRMLLQLDACTFVPSVSALFTPVICEVVTYFNSKCVFYFSLSYTYGMLITFNFHTHMEYSLAIRVDLLLCNDCGSSGESLKMLLYVATYGSNYCHELNTNFSYYQSFHIF
jgi:hypothetical protein